MYITKYICTKEYMGPKQNINMTNKVPVFLYENET